jgi:hypothetical protein
MLSIRIQRWARLVLTCQLVTVLRLSTCSDLVNCYAYSFWLLRFLLRVSTSFPSWHRLRTISSFSSYCACSFKWSWYWTTHVAFLLFSVFRKVGFESCTDKDFCRLCTIFRYLFELEKIIRHHFDLSMTFQCFTLPVWAIQFPFVFAILWFSLVFQYQ